MDDNSQIAAALQSLDPTTAPQVQAAVLAALLEGSGQLLGSALSSWIETGEPTLGHRMLLGPAGTVCLVAVSVRSAPAMMLGEGGRGA